MSLPGSPERNILRPTLTQMEGGSGPSNGFSIYYSTQKSNFVWGGNNKLQ